MNITEFHLSDIALHIGTKTYFFFIDSDLFDISEDKYFSEIIDISKFIY